MEESKDTVLYEDYKFLTANDLHQLNATHLIGSPMLKAYMHGYFIEMRPYHKLLSVADPFAYDRFRKEQINQKLNSLREKRIQVTK
jgi:ribosome biogenesis protein ENP2